MWAVFRRPSCLFSAIVNPTKPRVRRRADIELLEQRDLLAADLPYISEFLASNQDTLDDADGDSSDWIEIFNPTEEIVDLSGWFLTDDPANPAKWSFSANAAAQLEPFDSMVVFASGKDRRDTNYHTNFKLSAGGEYLALLTPEQIVASEFGPGGTEYPPQFSDVSYGFEGTSFSTDILYVDATSGPGGNTRLTSDDVFEPSGVDLGNNLGNDGAWEQRTFANAGTVFETGTDTAADDVPALTTSIEGLDAGAYEVFAYLWSDTNDNWDLAVGLSADDLEVFRPGVSGVTSLGGLGDGNGLASTGFSNAVLVAEGNRTLYQVSVGEVTVDDFGSIDVFIDDVPNANGRSWYDGVGICLLYTSDAADE